MKSQTPDPVKDPVWKPTKVQHLYRHRNGRYYARTFAAGKEKWQSLRTNLLSVAKNRMKEPLAAAETARLLDKPGENAIGPLLFREALIAYRSQLADAAVQPATKSYREAGIKLVLRSWKNLEGTNVRKITPLSVCDWLGKFWRNTRPHVPAGAKTAARNSRGASRTTIKCALDSLRLVLDLAVQSGHLYANPARHGLVGKTASGIFKAANRKREEHGEPHTPGREQLDLVVRAIRSARVGDCQAAADLVEFLAYTGARKKEAANAAWRDVDAEMANIQLRWTKNGEGRPVPVFAETKVLLERLANQRKDRSPGQPIMLVKEAQGFINSACKKLDIPRFTHHSLRDVFATTCLESGVDVPTVAKWLGHKDGGALLLKKYSKVRPQHEKDMIKRVSFGAQSASATPSV